MANAGSGAVLDWGHKQPARRRTLTRCRNEVSHPTFELSHLQACQRLLAFHDALVAVRGSQVTPHDEAQRRDGHAVDRQVLQRLRQVWRALSACGMGLLYDALQSCFAFSRLTQQPAGCVIFVSTTPGLQRCS